MSNLLTKAEIARLTGTSNPEGQKQVLQSNRIPYVRRRDGSVALTWDMVNQAVLARSSSTLATGSVTVPLGFNLPAAAG
jgi:hypothetical protein